MECPSAGLKQATGDRWAVTDCPAKLNLFLEVGGRRPDGYHELETVMAPLRLADRLWFRRCADGGLSLETRAGPGLDFPDLPAERDNLVWRVLDGFRQAAAVSFGGEVLLEKAIPMQAGLGGASSDAAAALQLANREWKVGWGVAELAAFAARFGSDIPYFLYAGWAVCRGRGEVVTRLPSGIRCPVVLIQPPVGFSTAEIYRRHRVVGELRRAEDVVRAIGRGLPRELGRNLFNRLEAAAGGMGPWLERLTKAVQALPVIGQQMTGSGSCYFGMFPNAPVARRGARQLKALLPDCRVILSELLPG